MDEKELFNRDSMYWRELNFSTADALAEIVLSEPMQIDGEELSILSCKLLPFVSAEVEYEMENGGAYRKNEVKSRPYVLLKDMDFYLDNNNSEELRNKKIQNLDHSMVSSISLKDKSGGVLLSKSKL